MVLVAILKPLADDALLEEVLRFQGTLSSSRTSWGEGPSSSSSSSSSLSSSLWASGFAVVGGDCRGSVLVKVRGDSLEMASPNALEKGVEAMKGPLSMVFPDGLEVVFPENVYLGEGLLF